MRVVTSQKLLRQRVPQGGDTGRKQHVEFSGKLASKELHAIGQIVGHWFHPNHDGHILSKKRPDPDFSVQNIGDVNYHRYKPFQLLAGISATTKRIYVEGSFVELETRALPNHHIINVSENISVELESQLLPNYAVSSNSVDDIAKNLSLEMKSQLLPNQHLSSNAEDRPYNLWFCSVGCTHWLQWAGSQLFLHPADAKQISSTFSNYSNVLNLPSDREQEDDFGTSLRAVQALLRTSIHQSRSQGLI
ncbi:hypothetical protein JRO89_XS13G0215600 [Xanthoceras sorbifolium]|uniref:Uncharacterized protein n=1 Tax=Xanthoceras sorbifolium TaxID=99658 RepID=A0ABQ8H9F5_9ROSI|nr:hypothetical protein JRO89_XS13G0215600 [Xanthoceras sorbifolium]